MESLNTYLRREARISYERNLAGIEGLIKYHDICKGAGELFVARSYERSYKVVRSSCAPTVVLSLEPKADISRVVAFFCEELEEKYNLEELYVRQDVTATGLELWYRKSKYGGSLFTLNFKLHEIKACTIIEEKIPYTDYETKRTIVC